MVTAPPMPLAGLTGALQVREIGIADLLASLRQSLDDFKLMPTYLVLLALIYPAIGLIAARAALGHDVVPLIFPMIAGFALVGPLATLGLYELSRRHEAGLDTRWTHVFNVLHAKSLGTVIGLGAILAALFAGWLWSALEIQQWAMGPGERTRPANLPRQRADDAGRASDDRHRQSRRPRLRRGDASDRGDVVPARARPRGDAVGRDRDVCARRDRQSGGDGDLGTDRRRRAGARRAARVRRAGGGHAHSRPRDMVSVPARGRPSAVPRWFERSGAMVWAASPSCCIGTLRAHPLVAAVCDYPSVSATAYRPRALQYSHHGIDVFAVDHDAAIGDQDIVRIEAGETPIWRGPIRPAALGTGPASPAQNLGRDLLAKTQLSRIIRAPVDAAHRPAGRHIAGDLVEVTFDGNGVGVGIGRQLTSRSGGRNYDRTVARGGVAERPFRFAARQQRGQRGLLIQPRLKNHDPCTPTVASPAP